MTFGFSLFATPLLAILVIYFRIKLGNFVGKRLLEDGKMCYC